MTAQVLSQAQYRTSFVVDLAGQTVFTVLDFVTVLVLFQVTPALGGFGLVEVLFMAALAGCAFALADLAVGNIERLRLYIRTGLLDAMLIRPRRVLPQLLVIDFQLRRVGRVVFTAVLIVVVASTADISWTWWKVALTVGTPLVGAVFFSSIFITTATVAFWWIDSGEFANSVTYGGKEFVMYPMTVYDGLFRRFFAFGLGFAFIAYYPSLAVLGLPDPLGMPAWFALGGPVVAAAATGLATMIWRTGIRHYKGTGS